MTFNHDRFKGKLIDLSDSSEATITKARKSASSEIRPNRSKKNASFVLGELLTLAEEQGLIVRLISGSLHSACYDALAPLADKILRSAHGAQDNPRIRVILTDPNELDQTNNAFYNVIKSDNEAAVKVAMLDGVQYTPPHFATVGELAFRFERNHETAEADYSFNNPSLARKIVDYFDSWYEVLPAFSPGQNMSQQSQAA